MTLNRNYKKITIGVVATIALIWLGVWWFNRPPRHVLTIAAVGTDVEQIELAAEDQTLNDGRPVLDETPLASGQTRSYTLVEGGYSAEVQFTNGAAARLFIDLSQDRQRDVTAATSDQNYQTTTTAPPRDGVALSSGQVLFLEEGVLKRTGADGGEPTQAIQRFGSNNIRVGGVVSVDSFCPAQNGAALLVINNYLYELSSAGVASLVSNQTLDPFNQEAVSQLLLDQEVACIDSRIVPHPEQGDTELLLLGRGGIELVPNPINQFISQVSGADAFGYVFYGGANLTDEDEQVAPRSGGQQVWLLDTTGDSEYSFSPSTVGSSADPISVHKDGLIAVEDDGVVLESESGARKLLARFEAAEIIDILPLDDGFYYTTLDGAWWYDFATNQANLVYDLGDNNSVISSAVSGEDLILGVTDGTSGSLVSLTTPE